MPSSIRIVVGQLFWGGAALALTIVVACSSPSNSSGGSGGTCPAPSAGQEACGSCGSQCFYCANGTCPADACNTHACDGTAHCSTKSSNPAHSTWSYCGFCNTSQLCGYCAPGMCPSDPCSTTCDGTGGNGPVGGGGMSSGTCKLVWDCGSSSQCATVYGASTGSAAEPDAATCQAVCKSQGACTCQGC